MACECIQPLGIHPESHVGRKAVALHIADFSRATDVLDQAFTRGRNGRHPVGLRLRRQIRKRHIVARELHDHRHFPVSLDDAAEARKMLRTRLGLAGGLWEVLRERYPQKR